MYSCHSCMDTDQQALVLPRARLPGCMRCLVRNGFCFQCSPWCLSGCSAGPGNALITAMTTCPGWRGASTGLLRSWGGWNSNGTWVHGLWPVDDTSKDNSRLEKVHLKVSGQAHAAAGTPWSISGCAWGHAGAPHSLCQSPTSCFHPLFHMHVPKTLEATILSEEALGKQLSVTGLIWFAVVRDIHKSTTG